MIELVGRDDNKSSEIYIGIGAKANVLLQKVPSPVTLFIDVDSHLVLAQLAPR